MVMCNMDIPRPPPPPLPNGFSIPKFATGSMRSHKSSNSQGFRLLENPQDDTASIYSAFKQKIDAMFAESDAGSIRRTNSIQARIERMFTDVAQDGGIPITESGSHIFSVDYMGAVPLIQKVSSLAGLQDPLKELYFKYKKDMEAKQSQELTGRLEISPSGLRVQYQTPNGDVEHVNSFPTIAVWSAVKFVLHEEHAESYAFLPLITDPDNLDKQTLFKPLNDDEQYVTTTLHSPLFAVVMRKIGVPKQLECHGFVCQTSEDAIVAAATLYKSLMSHMKAKDRKPKNRGGVACMSIASSMMNDAGNLIPVRPPRKKRSTTSSVTSDLDAIDTSDTQPLLPEPSKAPKKSTKNKRAPPAPPNDKQIDFDEIVSYEEPLNSRGKSEETDSNNNIKDLLKHNMGEKWNTYKSEQQNKITAEIKQVMSEGGSKGLKRVQSVRKRNEDTPDNSGDIFTKVTIPRSGSFLNAGGLTKYKSKITKINGQAAGGSPLGFNELFNEFRLQEGLHSVDEILGAIIDPEGMSFNDLKPIYKEFLLKLSVTLTKDELYQRSKAIMRRQKKKSMKRNTRLSKQKKTLLVNQKFKGFRHIFRKTLKTQLEKKLGKTKEPLGDDDPHKKLQESSISTSSYDTRQFQPRQQIPDGPRKQTYKKKQARCERTSTSEESDFFSLQRSKGRSHSNQNLQNRNSSSGYVSCSECSYDSDTCTCVSADKCYCSLGNKTTKKPRQRAGCGKSCRVEEKCYCTWKNTHDSLSYCGCDTDSCTDSNKCYCYKDQLNRRPATGSIMATPHHRHLCKTNSNTKSSKSLEYMPNPSEQYYEKLHRRHVDNSVRSGKSRRSYASNDSMLNYELFALSSKHVQDLYNRAVYGKAYSECGQPFCKQASMRSCSSVAMYDRHLAKPMRSGAISVDRSGACTEALSVKKSAEIAALFADIKLSQTTDITHMLPPDFDRSPSHVYESRPHSRMERGYTRPDRHMDRKTLMASQNRTYGSAKGRNHLYSTRNGLYTIQSQSDDSRRSSVCEPGKKREMRPRDGGKENDYFSLEPQGRSPVSQNIEDSLGYLP